MDSSYTLKEKSNMMSEDIRVSINSLRDALEITKRSASNKQYTENYTSNMNELNTKLNNGEITGASKSTGISFIPSNKNGDLYSKNADLIG